MNRPVLGTVDVVTKEPKVSFKERTDVTAVPAMGVVAETMVALVLAGESLRKFGGDSLAELVRNHDGYIEHLHETPSASRSAGGSEAGGSEAGGGQLTPGEAVEGCRAAVTNRGRLRAWCSSG